MLSKIAKPGDKIELVKVFNEENYENNEKNEKITTYFSQIYDIIEEDKLKIAMPIDGTRLLLLETGIRYELCIFSEQGMYKCRAMMTERYREGNIYIAIMELYTGLQKYQRRQHYRLECNIELQYRVLTEGEAELLLNNQRPAGYENALVSKGQIRGITLDISGGGVRFISQSPDMDGKYILIEFDVPITDTPKYFSIVAMQIDTRKKANRKDIYEHRVQFVNISQSDREDLIKYIFEEERRLRKNEKG